MRSEYLGRMVACFPGQANTGMSAIETETPSDPANDASRRDSDPAAGNSAVASQSSRPVLPYFALLLSAIALAGVAWTGWQLLTLRSVPSQLSNDAGDIQDLSRRLDGLEKQAGRQRQLIDDVETSLESGLGVIPDLSRRLAQNEQQVANIAGINVRGRSNWFKNEALYYLKIANAQAALTGNAQLAASALQLADDNLRDAGDPALIPVRAQLSEELAALKAVPAIDRTGIALRLQALGSLAVSWPFRNTAPGNFAPDIAGTTAATEATDYWGRFIATIKAVFSSIVSVKETDAAAVAQLSSVEEALIVATVRAELQLARLALIGRNDELFRQSLAAVHEQIDKYFDGSSASVAAAQTTLADLQAQELPGALPDIAASLTLLRALNNTDSADRGDL